MTTLSLTPSESVTVRSGTPEALEVEARYGPGGSPPPAHLHPAQDEHFEVLEGSIAARVGGQERTLGPGEVLDVPRNTVHQMWNPGPETARVLWRTTPAGRTLEWFQALDALQREGRVLKNGAPDPRAIAPLLAEYGDVFRLAGPAATALRPALAVVGAVNRLRGSRRTGGD